MSEKSGAGARQSRRGARRQPSESAVERAPDLTLLALLEGMAAAQRMGMPLPLAAYARAYPQHAGVLADYAAELWSEDPATLATEPPRGRIPLSAGTRNTLAQLFGVRRGTVHALTASERLVAELPSEYKAGKRSAAAPLGGDDDAGEGR